jgi:hypothetical protein
MTNCYLFYVYLLNRICFYGLFKNPLSAEDTCTSAKIWFSCELRIDFKNYCINVKLSLELQNTLIKKKFSHFSPTYSNLPAAIGEFVDHVRIYEFGY